MEQPETRTPLRDMDESVFTSILATLEGVCPGFETAVFFDGEGETIDYFSYLDPFDTRLTAAHIGVVVASAMHRFRWMNLGEVKVIEIYAAKKESVTISLGEDLFFSVVVAAGNLSNQLYKYLWDVTVKLRDEIGI